jgi:hypothetical protein
MLHHGLQADYKCAQVALGISTLNNIFLLHSQMETHDNCDWYAQ